MQQDFFCTMKKQLYYALILALCFGVLGGFILVYEWNTYESFLGRKRMLLFYIVAYSVALVLPAIFNRIIFKLKKSILLTGIVSLLALTAVNEISFIGIDPFPMKMPLYGWNHLSSLFLQLGIGLLLVFGLHKLFNFGNAKEQV